MVQGYCGKYLHVDLTKGEIETRSLNMEYAELFYGGPALGARMLWDLQEKGIDPLAPEAYIGFISGPFNGTGALFGGRYTVVCKSPVTGGFNDANSGGFFGGELKKCGYDAIFITGKADQPVYLEIQDDQCKIKDATGLWGKDYKESEITLQKTLDKPHKFAGIGQAGETLSLIAAVMNDNHRCAARGGSGAVMGSKNLKMIALCGTGSVSIADQSELLKINELIGKKIRDDEGAQYFSKLGTTGQTMLMIDGNDSGVKNWAGVASKYYDYNTLLPFSGEYQTEKWKTKSYCCGSCVMACGCEFQVDGSPYDIGETTRPEYETAAAFSSMILNYDVEVLLKCNELCNRYGLDTISAGAIIAWVMECYEHKILAAEELDGIEAEWGNGPAIVALIEKIGKGEGVGKILGQGSRKAAQIFNKGQEYLIETLGIEYGQHDPRYFPGLARTYQYDPTTGRHVKGGTSFGNPPTDPETGIPAYSDVGTGKDDVFGTCDCEFINATGLCAFISNVPDTQADKYAMFKAVTGMEMDDSVLLEFGKRSFAMRYAFNIREGIRKGDYNIPYRMIGLPPQKSGTTAGRTINAQKLALNFFQELGWDLEHFVPTKKELLRLKGFDGVVDVVGL